jgi:hypothetical protein
MKWLYFNVETETFDGLQVSLPTLTLSGLVEWTSKHQNMQFCERDGQAGDAETP